jgi:phosphoribosyl 1,2-cyclic phosphate phosphodiesterase
LKITFLGTGTSQGIPVIGCGCPVCTSSDYRDQRLRSSILIEDKETVLVIDAGPDFRQQMLTHRVKDLTAIVLTHEHKDHIAGLDDVRAFNYRQKRAMPIYCEERVANHIKQREFYYAFGDYKYPGAPDFELLEYENKPFTIKDITLIPIRVMHYKLPVFGFRVKDFTYITDANYIDKTEQQKILGSKTIVINGLQHEPHLSHFTIDQVISLLTKWEPQQAYLTHISHRLGLHREVEKKLPSFIKLAYDGLKLQF